MCRVCEALSSLSDWEVGARGSLDSLDEHTVIYVGALLSEEEIMVLQSTANGDSPEQIARRMNLSKKSVERRLNTIRQKLGKATTVQAVVEALRLGLIS